MVIVRNKIKICTGLGQWPAHSKRCMQVNSCHSIFLDEKNKAERGEVTFQRTHKSKVAELLPVIYFSHQLQAGEAIIFLLLMRAWKHARDLVTCSCRNLANGRVQI